MTERETLLHNLQRLADGIVAMFGRNCEVCIHDLTSLQNSLVYLQGDVTRRQVGAPATDLLVKMLSKNNGQGEDHHNYRTATADGRSLKSTTTIIRDAAGAPVAAFCINFDTTAYYNAVQALAPFSDLAEARGDSHETCHTAPPLPGNETFAQSVGETIDALFQHSVTEIGKHPATMHIDERLTLVSMLDESGTFQLKGAVEQVGRLMGVTKFTIYNYLKKVRTTAQETAE